MLPLLLVNFVSGFSLELMSDLDIISGAITQIVWWNIANCLLWQICIFFVFLISKYFWCFFLFFSIMAPFYGWGSTISRLESHLEEAVYFLPLLSQKFLVLILSTSEGWKAELTLEPPSGFEHGTPELRMYRPRTLAWLCEEYDCIVFSYNYMLLSCHVHVLEWIHTL